MKGMPENSIKEKFISMIDTFRIESDKLSPEEKKHLWNDFGKPCQLYIFSCKDYNLHLIIKTKFSELRDKTIELIEITPENFENQFDAFENRSTWNKKMEEKDGDFFIPRPKRVDLIRDYLVYFGQKIIQRRADVQNKSTGFVGDLSLGYWDFSGDVETIDLDGRVRGLVQGAKQSYHNSKKETISETPKPTSSSHTVSACGAYFYPFVLIGELKKTTKGQLSGSDHLHLDDIVYDCKFDDLRVAVTKAGLLVVETDDVITAIKTINTIFGTAMLLGLPVYSSRPQEIAFVYLRERAFVSSWTSTTIRSLMYDYRTRFLRLNIPRLQIHLKILKQIIQRSEKILKSKLDEEVRLLLESHTYSNSSENLQSFNTSWLIIEKYLRKIWDEKMKFDFVNKNMKNRDINYILKDLKTSEIITLSEYSKMQNLRGTRNKVFHGNSEPNITQTKRCFETAEEIIRRETRINKKFDFNVSNYIYF
ncbi:MAG: hypothetical protein LV477_00925 [Candidatus Nitrosotalea sp.]|nr:hypothetical protein [Candidatus Nitrosotalea sp.]